jgi:hypothetical protein
MHSAIIHSWMIFRNDPDWLINSLMQTVARLPHLTEFNVETWGDAHQHYIPVGLFSNLSKLSVACGPDDVSYFISQMSTVISNSPQLRSLAVSYIGLLYTRRTLSELFAKISTQNPLNLEHLSISYMDATVDEVVLPHLMHLASFQFLLLDEDFAIAQSVWTSFFVNNVKLSDVDFEGSITEETMLYLSSFSGLKRLTAGYINAPTEMAMEDLKNMFFTVVLPRHVNSLQTLDIVGGGDDRWVR